MDFTITPSLKNIALNSLAVSVWCSRDIKRRWSSMCKPSQETWMEVESTVAKKLTQLPLPRILIDNLLEVSRNTGKEIQIVLNQKKRQWARLLQMEHWTVHGTVDFTALATQLVGDSSIESPYRFFVACVYCFEAEIRLLWLRMNSADRSRVTRTFSPFARLVSFWICYVEGKYDEGKLIDEMVTEGLKLATKDCYFVAMRYFLDQINTTPEFVRELICKFASKQWKTNSVPQESGNAMLRYLLSLLDEDNRTAVIMKCSVSLMYHFVDATPTTHHFLVYNIAKLAKPDLTNVDFELLLSKIHGWKRMRNPRVEMIMFQMAWKSH